MLASVVIMMLLLSQTVLGAPTRDDDRSASTRGQKYDAWSQRNLWLLKNADLLSRIRRTHHIDAGFLSRHNAYEDYMKAIAAQRHASNPYGPGRRK
ncbi:hypothetical protein RRG08_029037 [Elysia crispata]|uniref:Uncharacterized protein n=1 Tax=Elysia crispata TaxID=231223 RepID=A0AAE1AJ84_9GAST|nr:hypothetical protein RRG08_029037 [Elysia crispata]